MGRFETRDKLIKSGRLTGLGIRRPQQQPQHRVAPKHMTDQQLKARVCPFCLFVFKQPTTSFKALLFIFLSVEHKQTGRTHQADAAPKHTDKQSGEREFSSSSISKWSASGRARSPHPAESDEQTTGDNVHKYDN